MTTTMETYSPLYNSLVKGDWESSKAFLDQHPEALTAEISGVGERALFTAVVHGHVELVEELVKMMPPDTLELKTKGETALHIAAAGAIVKIVKTLVERNENLVRIPDADGQLPVSMAAFSGSREMLDYLHSKTSPEDLRRVAISVSRDLESELLVKAIKGENYGFAMNLLERYSEFDSSRIDIIKALSTLAEMPFAFVGGSGLGIIRRLIYNYMIVRPSHVSSIKCDTENPPEASRSLQPSKSHSIMLRWSSGLVSNVLKLIDFKQKIFKMKKKNIEAHELLREIIRRMSPRNSTSGFSEIEVLGKAVKCGNAEVVVELLRCNPSLLWTFRLFHLAVVYRQEKIWNIIYGLSSQRNIFMTDAIGSSTLLHLAATLPTKGGGRVAAMISRPQVGAVHPRQIDQQESQMLKSAYGPARLVQRELQWYKEVEKLSPPSYKYVCNEKGQTPGMAFSTSHYELIKEGEKWMRDTATSCTIVAILVVTVMFAAAFTLPGGMDNDSRKPMFVRRSSFMIFVIADALSLFSSTTSVLMFLSILTARYSEDDFLESLPKRHIYGLFTLFMSIATMMIAFGANLDIVMEERLRSAFIPVSLLASIPAMLFAFQQLPLFIDMVSSTFGPSIFNKKTKSLFLTKNYS